MAIKKSELKEWAKEKFKGLENCLMPSFTPDMSELDEEGIRLDVRQSVKHGFFSMLCTPEPGITFEEYKRFLKIAVEEADGQIMVAVDLAFNSFKQIFEIIKYAEEVGCDCVYTGYPPNYYPKSLDEIYKVTKEMCDSTNLPIILYPSFKFNFERFHPSGFPLDLLSRMADIENTVAMKIGCIDPAFFAECFAWCGEKVLVQFPLGGFVPLLVREYGQQWGGAAPFEYFQTPENRYMVNYFDLLLKGEWEKAMEIYWRLTPARMTWERLNMQSAILGTYHWPMWKYFQWLVGGNGGYTRIPVMKLFQHDMEAAKQGLMAIGITPRQPDEEFYVGRVNYTKQGKA